MARPEKRPDRGPIDPNPPAPPGKRPNPPVRPTSPKKGPPLPPGRTPGHKQDPRRRGS
jgi:hypothetical protein